MSRTFELGHVFPPGTEVGAHKRSDWNSAQASPAGMPDGEPVAKPVKTAKVADSGEVSFAGLDEGEQYVMHAEVDGRHQYVAFVG